MAVTDLSYNNTTAPQARNTEDAVLVLRALGLGDAMAGIPALRGIRRRWPDRYIALAAGPVIGEWLRELDVIDEVLPTSGLQPLQWPPPAWISGGGHIAVDLHGKGPLSHQVLMTTAPDLLLAFHCPSAGHLTGPTWRRDEHEVQRWCRLVRSVGGECDPSDLRLPSRGPRGDEVILHPGAASAARRWPVPRWAWLAHRVATAGHPVVVTGGPGEDDLCTAVAIGAQRLSPHHHPGIQVRADSLSLTTLADVIGRAALLISGDTGVAHLATAFGTRSVLLFGPTPPRWWGPAVDQDLHTVLWHGQQAEPGDPHGASIDPALEAITGDEVLSAVEVALAQATPAAAGPGRTNQPSGSARRAS
jgi:ADP-heptose:LPS heptosyltransferase